MELLTLFAPQPFMSTPFQGPHQTSLDEKGRLSMPTRFRPQFASVDNKLTITRHPHGSLLIFTPEGWARFSSQILEMPVDSQWMKRVFYGYAMDLELDKSGRVTIPPELRAKANMTPGAEIMLLGMGNYIELWEAEALELHDARAMQKEAPLHFRELSF